MKIKLLTKALLKKIPPLYSTDGVPAEQKQLLVKFFTPDSDWTWYVAEGSAELEDGELVALSDPRAARALDVRFFGLVEGFEKEWGYFMLGELQSIRGKLGLPVERDRHWRQEKKSEASASKAAVGVTFIDADGVRRRGQLVKQTGNFYLIKSDETTHSVPIWKVGDVGAGKRKHAPPAKRKRPAKVRKPRAPRRGIHRLSVREAERMMRGEVW